MPRSYRRLAVLTAALVLGLALAGRPAQASEASGLIDTLSAQVASWMAAWWPWSPTLKGTADAGHSKLSPASDAGRVRRVAGGTTRGVVGGPAAGLVQTTDCYTPANDPNGCPP
jgi:hypothetical protein